MPGADINSARPTDNKTPLHVAASVSAPAEMISLLLQHGAKIHDQDTEGKKAVDLAPMDSQAFGVLKEHTGRKHIVSVLTFTSRNLDQYFQQKIAQTNFPHSISSC